MQLINPTSSFNPPPPSTGGIDAYTNVNSLAQGETISFHVRIQGVDLNNPAPFTITIKREEDTQIPITTLDGLAYDQSTNDDPAVNGCGWQPSLEWTIPSDLKSGAYRADFSCDVGTTYLVFIVKASNPGINSKILFISSITTWQAYNTWNDYVGAGKSLYYGPDGSYESRARKVSFNRPPRVWDFYQWEVNFIQWFYKAKSNNYLPSNMELEFCASVDLHENPSIVTYYNLVLSVGHDEYWSWEMRDTIQNFIANNGNVAFFSGNVSWWQVRFEPDQEGNPNRTLVCYKEIQQPDGSYSPNEDPYLNYPPPQNQRTSCNWFNALTNRPENLMTGASYYWGTALYGSFSTAYRISLKKHWLYKGSGLDDRHQFGDSLFTSMFETDAADFNDLDRKFPYPTGKLAYESTEFSAPKDLMILASANLTDLGETVGTWDGPSNHNGWGTIGIFRKRGGGFVFHAGNYNWARNGLYPYINQNDWNEFCWLSKNILEILGNSYQPQSFLLENPDFESNSLSGWDKTGNGVTSISNPGYNSNYCAFIDASNSSETYLSQRYIPVRSNRNYRIRCFVKPGNMGVLSNKSISIRLQTLDINNNPQQEFIIALYPINGNNWIEISAQGQISNSDDLLFQTRVKIQVETGQSAYFDNVIVEEMP